METVIIVMPILIMWIRLERKIGNLEGRILAIWSIVFKNGLPIEKKEGKNT